MAAYWQLLEALYDPRFLMTGVMHLPFWLPFAVSLLGLAVPAGRSSWRAPSRSDPAR